METTLDPEAIVADVVPSLEKEKAIVDQLVQQLESALGGARYRQRELHQQIFNLKGAPDCPECGSKDDIHGNCTNVNCLRSIPF